MARTYVINDSRATSTAITVLQIKAVNSSVEIIRAWANQTSSTTSAQCNIMLVRKSTPATVTALTPLLMDGGDAASRAVGGTAATGRTASNEGVNADILIEEGFNVLNGWLYLPVPEERIVLSPATATLATLGLTFVSAPPSATWDFGIVFREIG